MDPIRRLLGYFPLLVLARRNLSRAKARSALAIGAVVIGVVAIGAIGAGGEAFKRDQLEAYEGFGGTATVDPVATSTDPSPEDFTISSAELNRLRQAAGRAAVIPVIEPGGAFVRSPAGDPIVTAQIKGIEDPGTFYTAQAGSIPENWRRTAVVGSRVAESNGIEPGDRIAISVSGRFQRSFTVAAVLEPQGFGDPLSADQSVFVPLAQFESEEYDRVIVQVDPQTGSIEAAARRIETEFNARERTVDVELVEEQREQFEQFFGTINQFLVGIGSISLLVAAVTIGNTMLMSAIEREGEIGVLRAVGYPKTAVIRLLVTEATALGVVGAAVGAPIAVGVSALINQFLIGDPLAFTDTGLGYVAFGMGFGVLTATLAGLYPAWKAAGRRPVEVLD